MPNYKLEGKEYTAYATSVANLLDLLDTEEFKDFTEVRMLHHSPLRENGFRMMVLSDNAVILAY
jgi:hypothetical protein